jgi:tight adherence protein B
VIALVATGVVFALVAARGALGADQRARARRRLANDRPVAVDRLPTAPAWLVRSLTAAAISVDPRRVAVAWAALAVAAPLVALALGPGLAVAACAAAAVGPWLALRLARGRRAAQIEGALPLALEAVARALRTGGSLRMGVAEAAAAARGPLAADLAAVAVMVEHGAPLATALDALVGWNDSPGVRLAAAALALGAETGGAQARAIDGVAATIRERLAAGAELRAQATQARVSALVIAAAPLAFCALASSTDPKTATFLFRTPGGLILLGAGLGLDAAGAVWMNHLTRGAA